MAFGKKNVIKIDPAFYSLMLLGESKVGKSTLIKEYCEKIVGEDGYLFIETGAERGADAINGINYINAPTWNMEYDEFNNAAGFVDICEDIVENKTSEYPNLRIVVWDTLDQLIDIAEEESIRLYNKEMVANGKPKVKTINSAWGGYGRGEKKAIELMLEMRAKLIEVGVQVIIISHVKRKDVSDVVSGDTYQVLTSDQQQNYFNAFKKDMHFLALAYIDREMVKEKKKNGRGNDDTVNKVVGETRRIKFRDDSYAIDSGSRFADIEADVPMDVESFTNAIVNAIQAEASKGDKSISDLKKEQSKKDKEHAKKVAEAEKIRKEEKAAEESLNEIVEQIQAFFNENKKDLSILRPIADEIKAKGYKNPGEISDIDDAKEILAMCVIED